MESVEALEELQDALESGVTFWPWKKEEHILPFMSEESNGKEPGEEPKKSTDHPQNNPLPVAPSDDQVYILPSPAPKSTHAAPAPNHKSNPSLHVMQKFKKLVANVQAFATTLKTQAVAYIAWHSGWFGCRFGFGASEPRHF